MNRRMVGMGLTIAAVGVAGCGEKMGSGISAGENTCLNMRGTMVLPAGEQVFVAGDDIHYDQGIQDKLVLKNKGGYILRLTESGDDEGEISFADNVTLPDVTGTDPHDVTSNLLVPTTDNVSFRYQEHKVVENFSVSRLGSQALSLQFTVNCQK